MKIISEIIIPIVAVIISVIALLQSCSANKSAAHANALAEAQLQSSVVFNTEGFLSKAKAPGTGADGYLYLGCARLANAHGVDVSLTEIGLINAKNLVYAFDKEKGPSVGYMLFLLTKEQYEECRNSPQTAFQYAHNTNSTLIEVNQEIKVGAPPVKVYFALFFENHDSEGNRIKNAFISIPFLFSDSIVRKYEEIQQIND